MTDQKPPDDAFHLTGDRLGKFMILSELGRGSMGVVYEAFQEDLKRKVALKILPANITLDAKQVRRFHREAESVARLRHDNVIQIYEVGQVETTHYFAMELVEGGPLEPGHGKDRDAILKAARIARDAARGLAHAHEKGVIHRDIKPGNLLVDRAGRVVVTDFGLARLTDSASLTSTDAIVGTPKYMSPEQILAHAQRPVDGRADVYSLGATLYHVIAGRPPFDAPTVQGFIKAILEERPPSPRRINRQVPFDLATIILRCLEKDPADRYASATEMADDLDRFLAGERIVAKPKGVLALGAEAIRRHRLIAALVVLAALASGFMLFYGGQARQEQQAADLLRQLRAIEANEDRDAAVVEIENLLAREPLSAAVRDARARVYLNRAMAALGGTDPYFATVVDDLVRAGKSGTFWHLMALVEDHRLEEARAAAEAMPEASPLRRLTLARVALLEERYADVIALLSEPATDADHKAAMVFSALTRGLAHKGLGQLDEAKAYLQVADEKGNLLTEPWLRVRATTSFIEGGGKLADVLASLQRTVTASLRVLANLKEKMAPEEFPLAQRLIDSVLKIAKQPPVPVTELESTAREKLRKAKGADVAVAHLLLAIAQLSLDQRDLALESLDQAEATEEDAERRLDPYVYWARAVVLRLQGNMPEAVESAQTAIELALAATEAFPDLQYLCEHAALLAKAAPPAQAGRASDFLQEKLRAMPPGADWVNALLARLSAAPTPGN